MARHYRAKATGSGGPTADREPPLSVASNIGIALGSFASSELQARIGMRALGFPAAAVALAGLGLNLLLLRACRRG